jgi:hypothetical protein
MKSKKVLNIQNVSMPLLRKLLLDTLFYQDEIKVDLETKLPKIKTKKQTVQARQEVEKISSKRAARRKAG